MPSALEHDLLAKERQRCAALVEGDRVALRALLGPSLVHVHTRGNTDDLESYLAYVTERVQFLSIERDALEIRLHGQGCAVMTGVQTSRVRLRTPGSEPIEVKSRLMQVWIRGERGDWQQVAFQATPLGAPPPPLPDAR